jgi:D-glycero-D-manno-heptose 1,7-bisphosphate phosphatase
MATDSPTPVLYLDLDGTVRHGFDTLGRFVNDPEDVVIFPEALKLMRKAKAEGKRIVGISNQSGIALGHFTMEQCIATMTKTHLLCDQLFDKIAFCRHHPQAKDPEMAQCWCRKPRIGLIIETCLDMAGQFNEYYPPAFGLFVGDRPEDQQCAENAALPFMWAKDWRAGAESL